MTSATTLEEANAELTLRLRQQELAAEFANFSLQTDDLQSVLDEACRAASRGMECTFAKVLEHLPGEVAFSCAPALVGARGLSATPSWAAISRARPATPFRPDSPFCPTISPLKRASARRTCWSSMEYIGQSTC
jgi:hypothetical protein